MADRSIAELEARLAAANTPPIDPVQRIDALTELAWGLRADDTPRANTLATEARDLALEHDYTLGQARAVRTMGMTVHDPDKTHVVFELAEEARRLFDEAGDDQGRAASRDFLASIHEHIGDLAGGLELALDALSIARELGDPIRQGYALSNVGGILAASGEVEPAIERLKEALGLFEAAQDLAGVGAISSRLSKVLKDANRNKEALKYAEMCRDVGEQTQDEFLRCSALVVMAQLEDEGGRLAEAEKLYRAAIHSLESPIAKNMLGAETQIALGQQLIKRGALAEAEVELEDALGRIKGRPVSILSEAAAHEALADLAERRGELSLAIEHLRGAQALRAQIARREARNKLAQVEVRTAMVAARKDAEIHRLRFVDLHSVQSKLVEAEKMALLGKLAAGTAHELNTPLGVLQNNTRLSATAAARLVALVRGQGEISAQAAKLADVLESCQETSGEAMERIATIAQSFRRFTLLDQGERRTFDLREGVESALALLEPTFPRGITLERRLKEVPAIDGWPRELNHAFMTVLQNAVQAIRGEGVVSVETRATAEAVLVKVCDTGRGMTEEQEAHLFDVAWSEEGARTSMRLGLSAAYTTTQRHGGTLEVQSALGEGTVITFRFPLPGRA